MIRRHPVLSVITGAYLGGLAWMTLSPVPFDAKRASMVETAVAGLRGYSLTGWITTAGFETAIKVALFVPFGLLLVTLAGRRRWLFVVFLGVIASCWIELAQSIWVPSRAADAGDVMANSLGALLGTLIAVAAGSVVSRHSREHQPQQNRAFTPISQSSGSKL